MLSPLLSSITRLWRLGRASFFPFLWPMLLFHFPPPSTLGLYVRFPVQVLFLRFLTAHQLIHPFKDCSRWLFPGRIPLPCSFRFADVLLFPAELPAPGASLPHGSVPCWVAANSISCSRSCGRRSLKGLPLHWLSWYCSSHIPSTQARNSSSLTEWFS